jgi:galactokinase
MDQVACAVGGIVAIDFADPTSPIIDKVDFDLSANGYNLCIVNTGGNHADLTDDYASVPAEMKAVAAHFGKKVLREVSTCELIKEMAALREKVGDRAILRALHFFAENRRVDAQCEALSRGDLATFLGLVTASGRSSFCYLQNVYSPMHPTEQGLSLALALAEDILAPIGGACRVHGGGFAGTIQAFLPIQHLPDFCARMNAVFGACAATPLRLRAEGAVRLA